MKDRREEREEVQVSFFGNKTVDPKAILKRKLSTGEFVVVKKDKTDTAGLRVEWAR